MKAELRGNSTSVSLTNPNLLASGALSGCLGTLDGACIEKLLLHCASALESNDVTLAQQVMWVLNNVVSSTGDPNQRLASYFLRAFISKVSRVCPTTMNLGPTAFHRRLMSVTELAGYVDLIPWHRFGFCASNSAILNAIQGFSRIHILDFSITHCMQWPTLIDALSKWPEGPPMLRISVLSWRPPVPPFVGVSIEEVGQRLSNFAMVKEVPFEFNVVDVGIMPQDSPSHLLYDTLLRRMNSCMLNLRDDEALVVNIQNWLRYVPNDEQMGSCNKVSCRDSFLDMIKNLSPCLVTLVDEDCDIGSTSALTSRITTSFNYLWIPFDALETFLPKNSPQRVEYEADIGHKIESIIGFDGIQRIERLESGVKLSQRMVNKGFQSVSFCEETVKEVKLLLDEHSSGWGMKKDEGMLVLTWKGHSSVFATLWAPNASGIECWENSISN